MFEQILDEFQLAREFDPILLLEMAFHHLRHEESRYQQYQGSRSGKKQADTRGQ
jgi:hypothetical protein